MNLKGVAPHALDTAATVARNIIRPIKQVGKRVFEYELEKRTRLIPMSHTGANDVFIVGYPKSGNTWYMNLVAATLYGVSPEFCPPDVLGELVPDTHALHYYLRVVDPMFFKSHNLPKSDYKRVIYLVRDGRDVMTSYYRFLQALEGDQLDFANLVKTGEGLFPCKWHEHVEQWLGNPHGAQMMVVSYEDMKANCAREVKRFCDFMKIERSGAFIKNVASSVEFDKLRAQENRYPPSIPNWPSNRHFFRRGVVGSFRDEMPDDVLDLFVSEAGPMLDRLGYTDEPLRKAA